MKKHPATVTSIDQYDSHSESLPQPIPNDPGSDVMTLPEAAAFLRVCDKTVLKHAKNGSIPSKRIGTCWRFSRIMLIEWMQLEDAA